MTYVPFVCERFKLFTCLCLDTSMFETQMMNETKERLTVIDLKTSFLCSYPYAKSRT